jgi:hypothetical protein
LLKKVVYILPFFFIFFGCFNKSGKTFDSIIINQKTNKDVVGRVITFDKSILKYSGTHSIKSSNFKFLTFLDTECNSCINILEKWTEIAPKIDKNVSIIFLVQGTKSELFTRFLIENLNSEFVYYSDSLSNFLLDNNLQNYFQKTLILNKDNEVVYVGSPIDQHSPIEADLKELINEEY